jgi:hypothetical protein
MPKAILLCIVFIIAIHPISSVRISSEQHKKGIDISQYVFGRNMIINPCYTVIDDPKTTFKFDPNQLTITACNTHKCSYTLESFSFYLG